MEMRFTRVRLTNSERARYRLWWIEKSGIPIPELVSIAIDLGGEIGRTAFARDAAPALTQRGAREEGRTRDGDELTSRPARPRMR